jgi:dTDP-L-rhamnose 4-epimerase
VEKVSAPTRFLVTGGAGFIGSRLVDRLAKRAGTPRIWVIDSLHPQVHGASAEPPRFPGNVVFERGDVRDEAMLDRLVAAARPQTVFHLAAETGTGQSMDEPVRYCDVNVLGTAKLLGAIKRHAGESLKTLVLASSRAVYGEGPYLDGKGKEVIGKPRDPEKLVRGEYDPIDDAGGKLTPVKASENAAPRPASVYASTKLMQELLVTQAGQDSAWAASVLRLQNVYGPGQSLGNPYTGVLSIFSRQILEGRSLDIFEDGSIARDFVFVEDVVDALVACAERGLPHGTVVNIGSGTAVTILSVAKRLLSLLGGSPQAYKISGRFRVGDIRHACADIGLAKSLLAWSPRTPLDDGLRQLADWCRVELDRAAVGGGR